MLLGDVEALKTMQVKKGCVFRMVLYPEEGVVPKEVGQESRTKYFVILGYDPEGNYIGASLINSEINQKLGPKIAPYQLCIFPEKYDFLDGKPRYIDCYSIKSIPKQRIMNEGTYIGYIETEDFDRVCELLQGSPAVDTRTLQQYGLD